MMSSRVREINDATDGRVGVLEGWGGMYMLELIPAGIVSCLDWPSVMCFHYRFTTCLAIISAVRVCMKPSSGCS
jgi:hypothetical protein